MTDSLPQPIDPPQPPTYQQPPPFPHAAAPHAAVPPLQPGYTPQPGYPYAPQPIVHVNMYNGIVAAKSTGVAALLAALFGPLGMLYATVPGAIILFCANVFLFLVGFVSAGLSWLLLIGTWIGGIVWAYMAAEQHNNRLRPPQPYGQYPPQPRTY